MNKNSQDCEDRDIDIGEYIKTIFKYKWVFIIVFLLTFAAGLPKIISAPKLYRSTMMIQPPVIGPALTGANDLDTAENLKGLIINNVFKDNITRKLQLEQSQVSPEFMVEIPDKTNILMVHINLGNEDKSDGVLILKYLKEAIMDSYAKRIEAERFDIDSQIKSNKREIVNAKKTAGTLKNQIKELMLRDEKLSEEIRIVNKNTDQILEKREALKRGDTIVDSVSYLLLANYIQNSYSYLNQLNSQSSQLNVLRGNLILELENTSSQISNFQIAIDRLKIKYGFISNVKTVSEPQLFTGTVNSSKIKAVVILIAAGLLLGLLSVFLRGFWMNNLVNK